MNMPPFISRLTALFALLVLAPISPAADRVQAEDQPTVDTVSKSAPIPKISFQRAWPGVKTRRPVQIDFLFDLCFDLLSVCVLILIFSPTSFCP